MEKQRCSNCSYYIQRTLHIFQGAEKAAGYICL